VEGDRRYPTAKKHDGERSPEHRRQDDLKEAMGDSHGVQAPQEDARHNTAEGAAGTGVSDSEGRPFMLIPPGSSFALHSRQHRSRAANAQQESPHRRRWGASEDIYDNYDGYDAYRGM
jgi:hypothetical protein